MKAIVCGLAMLVAGGVPAQDLVVYDDDVRNGFIDDSYGGGSDFEHATTVRTGAASIAFTPNNFNAVAFTHPTQSFTQTQYVGARLWIHGGASGGQDLDVFVYEGTGDEAIASGSIDSYVAGGALAANEWRLAEIRFANAPISYAGSYMRFEVQAASAGAQPILYIDDVALISATRPDAIFDDGFEGDAVTPLSGTLQFTPAAPSQSVAEGAGPATFTIVRTGGSAGTVGTTVALGGTATDPADYTSSALALSWGPGDATARTVVLTLVGDDDVEPTETVTLALGAPTGGATLGAPESATLSILDDDAADAGTIAVQQDVVVSGRTSDRYTWLDASGLPRSAALSHNNQAGGGGTLREYTYRVGAATRTAAVTDSPFSVGRLRGFGYIVSHLDGYDFNTRTIPGCAGQVPVESPLGDVFVGTFQRFAVARHHAIHRFTLSYPLYGCENDGGPITLYPLAVTIDWFFATGRDHPVWAASLDLSSAPAGAVSADSRSPYGELLFDGSATSAAHALIDGVAWGDGRLFTTTTDPVTYNSDWTWNGANSVPFVKLWTEAPDATMGIVQTQTKAQHDAGGYFGASRWDTTSAAGPACTPAIGGTTTTMPCNFNWPYQSLNYQLDPFGAPNSPTNDSRLAWGTNYGAIGSNAYYVHGSEFFGGPNPDSFADGHPVQNYATWIVLGTHTGAPVEAQVAELETVQQTTLTSIPPDDVRTFGQAGPADLTVVPYQPAGWDHVYGVWTVEVDANAADVNFAIGAGRSLRNPILNVRNWQGTTLPASVTLNGVALVQDVDYFPSIVDAADELLITLNRTLSGANNRVVVTQ